MDYQEGNAVPPNVSLFNPLELAPAVGFAHAAEARGIVWLAGQISSDASGAVLFPGELAAQFRQAIQNVGIALRASGCTPKNVVKLTYYVTDIDAYRGDRRAVGTAYREVFGKHYPAASLFEVRSLFEPEAMVEIECIAVRPDL